MDQSGSTNTKASGAIAPQRIMSVDALRGFDMFWIAGGGPFVMEFFKLFSNPLPLWLGRQLDHVEWEGFVGWDLIMPLFLFIVGVAMPFSVGKRIERGDGRRRIYGKLIYRVVVLWILGMVAQGHLLAFDINNLQFYSNTLQAIAAGYLISGIALVELPVRGQAALAGSLMAVYWALMRFVPVPGHGVTMQALGKRDDGNDRDPVKFTFKFADQNTPRYWLVYTGQKNFVEKFEYSVRVVVKGTLFTHGQQWSTTTPISTGGSGGLMVTVPTPDDPNVTKKDVPLSAIASTTTGQGAPATPPPSTGHVVPPPSTLKPTAPPPTGKGAPGSGGYGEVDGWAASPGDGGASMGAPAPKDEVVFSSFEPA